MPDGTSQSSPLPAKDRRRNGHAKRRKTSAAGTSEASLLHVAKAADVSLGTVSRVMNNIPNVDANLRRRVNIAARELGYQPKVRRRHLALITGTPSTALPVGYVSIMTNLLMREAASCGVGVETMSVDQLDQVGRCDIDAAIGVVFDDRFLALRTLPNLPLLTINHPLIEHGVHGIYTDHFEQGAAAARHLIEHGHRRIAYLAIEPDEWGSRQRRDGYRAALREAGIEPNDALERYSSSEAVYDVLLRWTRQGVTGILNFSEDAAAEALHILSNILNLRIGADISTITLEDLPIYQYFSPPQTVIAQPMTELARCAVAEALRLTVEGDDDTPLDICLHGRLIERDSVGRLEGNAK